MLSAEKQLNMRKNTEIVRKFVGLKHTCMTSFTLSASTSFEVLIIFRCSALDSL